MGVVVHRFDVVLINLSPTIGREIQKTRPCLVISPDEMNQHIGTIIIAPMTTRERSYPTRVSCSFQSKTGQVVLDQIRTVDKARVIKNLEQIDPETQKAVLSTLAALFAE